MILLAFFCSLSSVPCSLLRAQTLKSQFSVPKAPHISAIFSPNQTVLLQSGDFQRLLRFPEVLPTSQFSMVTKENDLVEFTFPDHSIFRLGPDSTMICNPNTQEITVVTGSFLAKFSPKTTLQLKNLDLHGKGAMALVSIAKEGVKVFSLAGELDFHGTTVKLGEMYFFNGQPKMQGPFLVDLKALVRSSPITIEFPKTPWIEASMVESYQHQKRMIDFGLVEPSNVMMEGGGIAARSTLPVQPPAEAPPPQADTTKEKVKTTDNTGNRGQGLGP